MRFALFAAAALLGATCATAEPYVIDKSHAHVTFTVSHLGFSVTHGQFREFDAEIDFDPEAIEATTISFTIDATSLDTGWPARDKHVLGKDFLDTKNHPQITFASTNVRLTSAKTADVTGDVTIRGKTLPTTFQAKLNRFGPSPFDKKQKIAGFTVTGEIDRRDFGISFGAPAIGAVIPIRLDFEMSPQG